jgi:Tol biopolymer transport system component
MSARKSIGLNGCIAVLGIFVLACGDGATATAPTTQRLQAKGSSGTIIAGLTGSIVYGNNGLHIYHLATSTDVSLGVSGANPDFSPDGTLITYQQPSGPGKGIRVMNSNGTGGYVVTASGANPSFDPTGTMIAFVNGGVWKINVDGTRLTQLTTDAAHWPAWSPDGTQIAYGAPVGSLEQIFIVNADGMLRHQALATSGSVIDVAWRPSSKILFGMNNNLYTYDPANPSSLTSLGASGFEPSWSPDGMQISWTSGTTGNKTSGIWIMNADGNGKQGPVIPKGRQGSWGR